MQAMADEPDNMVLRLLREMRSDLNYVKRKVDTIEAEIINLRDREIARMVDMQRLERTDHGQAERLREIE